MAAYSIYVDSNTCMHASCDVCLPVSRILYHNIHQDEAVHEHSTDDDHIDESVHSDDVGSYYITCYVSL